MQLHAFTLAVCGIFVVSSSTGALLESPPAFQVKSDPNAKDIIDRAIEAHGGKRLLSKIGFTYKFKGTYFLRGAATPTSGFIAAQGNVKARYELNDLRTIIVIDGDQGWMKADGIVQTLNKEDFEENRQFMHADWVATLSSLYQKDMVLTVLAAEKIDDRIAHTIRVSYPGQQDVDLGFDSESLLLVKVSYKLKTSIGTQSTRYSLGADIQRVDGIRWPLRWKCYEDGKKVSEIEFFEYRFLEEIDVKLFAKPD